MIAQKIAISGFGILGLVGTVAAWKTGFLSSDEIDKKDIEFSYLLVKNIHISDSITSTEFLKENKPNYICTFKKQTDSKNSQKQEIEEDKNCELYKLNDSDQNNQTIIDMPKNLETSKPNDSNLYLLKINKKKYEQILNTDKTISLIQKDAKEKFGNLEEITILNIADKKIKTNLILTKINPKVSGKLLSTTNNDYLCKLNNEEESDKNCKVYLFTTDPTTTNGEELINTSHLVKGTGNTNDTYAADGKYALIEISDISESEKTIRSYSPIIYKKPTNANGQSEKFFSTQYVNSYVGKISDTLSNSTLLKITPELQDYLIVVHSTTSGTLPTNDLTDTTNKNRNYQCKFGSNGTAITDKNCVLYPIEKPTDKSIDKKLINDSNVEITTKTDKFKENKFFKLSVSNSSLINKDFSDSDEITIESKTETENSNKKSYGTIKVIGKIINNEWKMKTNLFLAKSKLNAPDSTSVFSGLKCKLVSESTQNTCDVYKTTQTIQEGKTHKDLNISQFTTAIAAKEDINKDKIVMIKFTETNSKNKSIPLKDQEIIIYGSNNSEINKYQILSPIYSKEETINSDTSIILN